MTSSTTRAITGVWRIAMLLGLALVRQAAGQITPPGDMPQRPAVLENAKPDAFYLRDEDGTLVLVPNLTWEEYDRLMKSGRTGAMPYYSLITTLVQGRVIDDRAELKIRLEIGIDRGTDQAIGIPLRLHPAILRDTHHEGFGTALVSLEKEAEGYVCWLSASAKTRHTITLDMVVPVRRVGDQTRLELELPDALSHIELILPLDHPDVQVEGDRFLLKEPQSLGVDSSKVEIDAFGGDLNMQWQAVAEVQGAPRPSLTATSQVTYTIQDPTYVLAEALLELRADRGEFGTFHVRLPPGMALLTRETAGYSVQTVESSPGGTLVRVDLESSRERTATIRLLGEISRSSAAVGSQLEVLGFIVPEAYYQRSDLVLAVDGNWSVRTVQSRNVRRVDTLSDAERQSGAIAKYLWYANRTQPSSLKIAIQPQESLITIDPLYVLHFNEQRARVDVILKFHVRGATARGFDFEIGEWVVREVKPLDLLDAVPTNADGDPLVIPIHFASDQLPPSGEFEVRISLERTVPLSAKPLTLPLPRPISGNRGADGSDKEDGPAVDEGQKQSITVTPATLVVYAAESLDFAPLLNSMPDFSQSSADPLPLLPGDIREQVVAERLQHFQAAATDAAWQFVCQVLRRPQSITSKSRLDLNIEGNRIEATQTLDLQVAYEPLQKIVLEAPTAIGTVTLWYDDQPLTTTNLPTTATSSNRMSISATLPVPQLGHVPLKLTYRIAIPDHEKQTQWKLPIPAPVLVEPSGAKTESMLVIHHDQPNWQFAVADSQWQSLTPDDEPTTGDVAVFGARGAFSAISLDVSTGSALEGPTIVRSAWFQTVYSSATRFDRAVFLVTTPRSQLEFELPRVDGRGPVEVLVGVDGHQSAELRPTGNQLMTVNMPRTGVGGRHLIEIWCTIPTSRQGPSGAIQLTRLRGASGVFISYWQLVLPRSLHLLADPAEFTPEYRWQWQGLGPFWKRVPNQTQRDLEIGIGATRAEPIPAQTNQYLFSTFGAPERIHVWTISRGMLVLLVSGLVLIVGLTLVHVPVARHPGVLLVIAVLAMSLALVRPGYGVLLAQAGFAGFVLVIASRICERLFVRRRSVVHVSRASSFLPEKPGRADSIEDAPAIGTTASAPLAVEISSGEIDL